MNEKHNHKDEERIILRNISLLPVIRISLCGIGAALPIIVVFWKQLGLSQFQISTLQATFALLVVALELPSGYLADRVGKARVIQYSACLSTIGFSIYWWADTFVLFLLCEVILGVATAFLSGADSALLWESLEHCGRQEEYERRWGAMIGATMLGLAIASVIGAFLFSLHPRAPFFLASAIVAVKIPVSFFLRDIKQPVVRTTPFFQAIGSDARSMINLVQHTPKLIWVTVIFALFFVLIQSGLWLYQPAFLQRGINPACNGLLFLLFNAIAAIAARFAARITALGRKCGTGPGAPLACIMALAYLVMALNSNVWSIGVLCIFQIARGWAMVWMHARVHEVLQSSLRATAVSAVSMSGSLLYALCLLVVGAIVDWFGLRYGFLFLSAVALCSVPLLLYGYVKLVREKVQHTESKVQLDKPVAATGGGVHTAPLPPAS